MRGPVPRSLLLATILAGCIEAGLPPASAATENVPRPHARVLMAVVLSDDGDETRREAIAAVRAVGGAVAHRFDGFLVAEMPAESVSALLRSRAVKEVSSRAVAQERHRRRSAGFDTGLGAWNRFFKEQERRFAAFTREGEPPPSPDGQDSWFPPPSTRVASWEPISAARSDGRLAPACGDSTMGASSLAARPYGATDQNTSEFLAGAVSINLFLVESDGSRDLSTENWTPDREQAVVSQVAAGLDWLRAREPAVDLSFAYHVVTGRTDGRARTAYEPISRKADPMGLSGEDLWMSAILANMGYSAGDRWTRSRALANATRRADGTDWGVNLFVVDSLNDPDGRFADGYFAYAWIGGPHVVMTYDDAAWGIDRMNQVIRHEMLHSFFAFDEYSGSGCSCTEHRGYLDGANVNCRTCNPAAAACVMESNGPAMCPATRRQIGWADLDGDGSDDVVGEDPDTVLDGFPPLVCGSGVAVAGQGAVVAATNRNPAGYTPKVSISVNRIVRVDWRADGGAWTPTSPADGAWGDYVESIAATVPFRPGVHTLALRAVDDHGNIDLTPPEATVNVAPGAPDPGNAVALSRGTGGSAALRWTSAPAAPKYRVYRSNRASGGFTRLVETAGTAWNDSTAGNAYYRVRSVDACGGESTP